ncbi:23S rRNA m(5)U-1939 methyltransferase [Hathewaya proteolytica DSM 3090]|uniref:23S rRNA m(5)U-1939 methyltransferase n=1 Tax=Hathewaya proteolytica DSM 3090 TaxID=1121331 RepID=A0A1M6RAE6_9CLOT|nr:23S rRNA (uracil(1939)-C(5))-methyltransferase RlmD [Hathewaya proteolytica]SHK29449.1 23S rRNA m(5)U-1939 methyltransferase [Hathewaya proteolytica DSM 3090]
MKKGKEYEFNIEGTAFPAIGLAKYEDTRVHVKGAYPMQKVRAKVNKKGTSRVEAKLLEILEKAPYQIEPKCPITDLCGGCACQDIPYEKQVEFKDEQLKRLFRNAGFTDFNYEGVEKSPAIFEYRNKMEFTFGDMEKGGQLTLGMHVKNRGFSIVSTEPCMIMDSDFRKLQSITMHYFREKGFSPYKVMKREGYLRHFVIRKSKRTGEILVNLVTTTQVDFDLREYKELILNQQYEGTIAGILHTSNDSFSDAVIPEKVEVLYGVPYIYEELLGLKFKISPFSFFQTNTLAAEELYKIVRDFLGDTEDKVVFDLYCGTGTIGQIVAPKAKKVIGIELIEEAVEAAKENAALNNLTNCEFIAGDVAKTINTIEASPDTIILDPPRPGVHPVALQYVVKFNPKNIIYVSCNPKTLVEDLKYLTEQGYVIEKVRGKDMFAHTPHVETVALIRRVKK